MYIQKSKMDIEAVEEAVSCILKVTDNIQELLESEDGIATNIMNEHRSYNHHLHPTMQIFKPTTQIYTKLLSRHSMTNIEALEKMMKKQASFFGTRGNCNNQLCPLVSRQHIAKMVYG